MTPSSALRVGIVGTGKQAKHHLDALLTLAREREPVQLAGVVDVDPELAQSVGARFGVPAYTSVERLHDAVGLDAVISAVPNPFHAEVALGALSLGLHVLSEKPMATSSEDAARMLSAAQQAGRVLMIGYPWPARVDWLREVIRRGRIGVVRSAELRFSYADGQDISKHLFSAASGGALRDLGGHPLAALMSILDAEPLAVHATSSNQVARARHGSEFEADDTTESYFEFSDGLRAHHYVSLAAPLPAPAKRLELRFYGDLGMAEQALSDEGDTEAFRGILRLHGKHPILGPPPPTYTESIIEEDRNFIGACLGMQTLRFTAAAALKVELGLDAARRSALVGGWVNVQRSPRSV